MYENSIVHLNADITMAKCYNDEQNTCYAIDNQSFGIAAFATRTSAWDCSCVFCSINGRTRKRTRLMRLTQPIYFYSRGDHQKLINKEMN